MEQNTFTWTGLLTLKVSASGMRHGAFSKGFSRAFDIGGLFLTLHDGSKLCFDNVADKVLNFWRSYFEAESTSSELKSHYLTGGGGVDERVFVVEGYSCREYSFRGATHYFAHNRTRRGRKF
jgi:hypothetical protein